MKFLALLFTLIYTSAQADSLSIDTAYQETFTLFDINGDNQLSADEMRLFTEGYPDTPSAYLENTEPTKSQVQKFYQIADTDNNTYLSATEFSALWKLIEDWKIKARNTPPEQKRDLSTEELSYREYSLQELEDTTRKLSELNKELESIQAEEKADAYISNAVNAELEKDYAQMDTDNNNCVSAEEYGIHTLKQVQKTDADTTYSVEDFAEYYQTLVLETPNCLTKAEYIHLMTEDDLIIAAPIDYEATNRQLDTISANLTNTDDERQSAVIIRLTASYSEMDSDNNSCATAEEYATFALKELGPNNHKYTHDYFIKYFNTLNLKSPNCMTQNEYMYLMTNGHL